MCPSTYWSDSVLQIFLSSYVRNLCIAILENICSCEWIKSQCSRKRYLLNLTCSFLECIREAGVPWGPGHLLIQYWVYPSSQILPLLYLFLSSRNFSLFTSSMTRLYVWPLRRETILHHLSTTSHQPDPSLQSPLMNRSPFSPPFSPVLRALEGCAGPSTPHQALSVRP